MISATDSSVFLCCKVFFYVPSAMVDLSVFGGDQALLIQSLRSAHRSLRFQPSLQQRKATIEGPFTAIQALREDLICRASRLKSTVSAQTAPAKLRETPPDPKVISHHKFVSPVSCSGFKAKLEPASSNSLSALLQTTGEATQVQTLLSNAKTQNTSSRQKVSCGSLAVGSFCNTDSDEEEQRARSRLQMPTDCRTERTKADPRRAFREEINAGITSSLSGLDLLPPEDKISQNLKRPDRVLTTKIRGEKRLGSHDSNTDCPKESDQSSSAVTATLLQTKLKDVSKFTESDTEELSAICPEHPEDTCLWVDSYTFRYIEKFDKEEFDRCLEGLDASVECVKGTDLVRILLTEKETSKTSSRIQRALKKLSTLVEFWLLMLRVNEIYYDRDGKQKLIQICEDVNFLYDDVLYMLEDCCIKVIGPSVSSYLFYRRVEDRIAKLKDKSQRM